MPLNDKQITARMGMITPFVPEKTRHLDGVAVPSFGLGSMGYDIRLEEGSVVEVETMPLVYLDPTNEKSFYTFPVSPNELGHIVLLPGHLYLASTVECFDIPSDILGLVFGKSTYARLGLIPFMTPLEPGWKGFLTLEFTVTRPLRLIEGAGIAQVVFFQGDESTTPYTGKYQNQTDSAVGAMVGDDIVVNWDLVPEGWDWVAVDKRDTGGYAYKREPFKVERRGCWLGERGEDGGDREQLLLHKNAVTLPASFDWRQSLRRRPQ